jgi:predicted anti-sigma-YlaC factor YlaD
MRTPDCQALEQAVFETDDPARMLATRPDLAAHVHDCAGCREWLETFARGMDVAERLPDFRRAVVARTVGTACRRVRDLLGAAFDEPLATVERTLVDAHLEACESCRSVAATMREAAAVLPALAEVDPGPAFTWRVLAATSRRAVAGRPTDRWRRAWVALVGRPRFALEAAYALTLVLILVAGSPLSAWERTVARVEPLARTHVLVTIGALDKTIDAHVGVWKDSLPHATAVVPASSGGSGWLGMIREAFDALIDAAGAWMRQLVATVETLAHGLRQWTLDFFSGTREPASTAARSPQ